MRCQVPDVLSRLVEDAYRYSAIPPFDHPEAQTLGWNIPEKAASEFAHFVKGDKTADVSMEEYNGHTFQVSHIAATFTLQQGCPKPQAPSSASQRPCCDHVLLM
jgi:hypothetical protein